MTDGIQIAGITPTRTTLDGTEFLAGQTAAAGPSSTFKVTTGTLKNTPREAVTVTTNTAISSADSGKRITNNGASANLTWPLPPAVVGRVYEIQNATDAYTLTIDPDGTDRIGTGAAGKYLRLLNRGVVVLECQYSGRWEVTHESALIGVEL
jgi:hypothetical protein